MISLSSHHLLPREHRRTKEHMGSGAGNRGHDEGRAQAGCVAARSRRGRPGSGGGGGAGEGGSGGGGGLPCPGRGRRRPGELAGDELTGAGSGIVSRAALRLELAAGKLAGDGQRSAEKRKRESQPFSNHFFSSSDGLFSSLGAPEK